MFVGIPQINKFVSSVRVSRIDDFVDRCNYYYTVLILLFFTLLVGTKQYFGEPIRCLIEQQYPGSWVNYVHDYCFIMERYSLTSPEFFKDFAAQFYDGPRYLESSYQWIPFLLVAQAFCFCVPHFLWRSLQKFSNLDVEMVVEEAVKIHAVFGEDRQKAIENLAKYIEQYICFPTVKSSRFSCLRLKRMFCCSTWLYIFSKLLNSINIIVQLFVINSFVGNGNFFWGVELFDHLISGRDWTKTGYFPRVVFCDYELVKMANVEKKTTQCTLTINILNEKIFLLLTMWLFFLFVCTASNALFAIITTVIPSFREREARFYLMASISSKDDENTLETNYSNSCDRSSREFLESCPIPTLLTLELRRRNNGLLNHDKSQQPMGDQACDFDRTEHLLQKTQTQHSLRHFLRSVLGIDGIQLIRFVRAHAGALTARDVTQVLWEDYLKAKQSQNRFCERMSITEGCN